MKRLKQVWNESREEQRWRDEFRNRLPALSDDALLSTLRLNLDAHRRGNMTDEMALRIRARLHVGKEELKRRGLSLEGVRD